MKKDMKKKNLIKIMETTEMELDETSELPEKEPSMEDEVKKDEPLKVSGDSYKDLEIVGRISVPASFYDSYELVVTLTKDSEFGDGFFFCRIFDHKSDPAKWAYVTGFRKPDKIRYSEYRLKESNAYYGANSVFHDFPVKKREDMQKVYKEKIKQGYEIGEKGNKFSLL